MRNLHLKEEIPKLWGHILVSQVKEKLMSNMTIFQIGAKSGHRAAEHIYVMKSVMQKYEYLKNPLIVSFWDFKTFFDSESGIDVMAEVYKCGIKGKLYRLLYKLNEDTVIRVSTPVGVTEETSRGEGIGQGTNDARVL